LNEWIKASSIQKKNWKICEICRQPYRITFGVKRLCSRSAYHCENNELFWFILGIIATLCLLVGGCYVLPILIVYYALEKNGFNFSFVYL
jgi:hypothetical protein